MGKSRVSIICAMDGKRGIGKGNNLLFKIPEDFERMRALTLGHPLVMGRRTFESIGRVLPGRTSVVITSDESYKIPFQIPQTSKVEIAHSLGDGMKIAQDASGADEIFIFGGGQVFKEALEKDLVDRLYLTVVEGDFGADTFFPDYSRVFKVLSEEKRQRDGFKYSFLTLERKS